MASSSNRQSFLREPFLAGSHLLGALVALIGTIILAQHCCDNNPKMIAALIYGITMTGLFISSTLLHGVYCSKAQGEFLERLDYASIYLFIAGTYTPVSVFVVGGAFGYGLLIAQWSMAIVGVALTLRKGFSTKGIQIAIFLAMGWMFIATVSTMFKAMAPFGFNFLLVGAACYSIGALVFAFAPARVWSGRVCTHSLWHILVLLGAFSHFTMVFSVLVA